MPCLWVSLSQMNSTGFIWTPDSCQLSLCEFHSSFICIFFSLWFFFFFFVVHSFSINILTHSLAEILPDLPSFVYEILWKAKFTIQAYPFAHYIWIRVLNQRKIISKNKSNDWCSRLYNFNIKFWILNN